MQYRDLHPINTKMDFSFNSVGLLYNVQEIIDGKDYSWIPGFPLIFVFDSFSIFQEKKVYYFHPGYMQVHHLSDCQADGNPRRVIKQWWR